MLYKAATPPTPTITPRLYHHHHQQQHHHGWCMVLVTILFLWITTAAPSRTPTLERTSTTTTVTTTGAAWQHPNHHDHYHTTATLQQQQQHDSNRKKGAGNNNNNNDIPTSFDCAMRKAAYEYGKHLMPRHSSQNNNNKEYLDLYYALNLNDYNDPTTTTTTTTTGCYLELQPDNTNHEEEEEEEGRNHHHGPKKKKKKEMEEENVSEKKDNNDNNNKEKKDTDTPLTSATNNIVTELLTQEQQRWLHNVIRQNEDEQDRKNNNNNYDDGDDNELKQQSTTIVVYVDPIHGIDPPLSSFSFSDNNDDTKPLPNHQSDMENSTTSTSSSSSSSFTSSSWGSKSSPFQSIQLAADYAAHLKQKYYQSQSPPPPLPPQQQQQRGSRQTFTTHFTSSNNTNSDDDDDDENDSTRTEDVSILVVLRGGTYYIKDTIILTSYHNGIQFVAYPWDDQNAVISGGIPLEETKLSWTRYEPPSSSPLLQKRKRKLQQQQRSSSSSSSPPPTPTTSTTTSNIWVTDLSTQSQSISSVPGLQINGQRATRARYPNLPYGIEVSCGYGCMIPSHLAQWTGPIPSSSSSHPSVQYYKDINPLHNRSNGGWFEQYMIGTYGSCSVYDPPVSYWCSEHSSGGGAFSFRIPTGIVPDPMALPHSNTYNWSSSSSSMSKLVRDMIFFVWHPGRWANWMFHISYYNVTNNNYTFGYGGFQGARGQEKGGDWYVENLLEELDHPGEFYYDSDTQYLYLYYNDSLSSSSSSSSSSTTTPSTTNEDAKGRGQSPPPPDTHFVIPQHRTIINISGTQWDPIWDVKLHNLTFRSSRYTYMDPHGVPSGGDWALERNAAIVLQGTHNTIFQHCIWDRLDGNGILISGYNRNVTIKESDFSYLGGTAIVAWGYTNETATDPGRPGIINDHWPQAGIDGTDGEHPHNTQILNCTAREVGLYEKQSSFYMQAKTSHTKLLGNVFFNGPRAGINFNDGFGGGDEIAYNLIFSTCRESGDHGPFNSWDRQPFYTWGTRNDTDLPPQPNMIMDWRHIHHNFFIDNYSPQEAVDNDDGSAYFFTHDNFFVYGQVGMKNDFGGHSNHHYNNIYGYVQQAMRISHQLPGKENHFYNNRLILRDTKVGTFQCSGPGQTILHNNTYYTPTGQIEECGMPLTEWQSKGHDPGSRVLPHPEDDATIIGWAKELLGF